MKKIIIAIATATTFTLLAWPAPEARLSDIPASQEASQRARAYYHFALGHLYAELAAAYGNRGDLLDKAIENYRLALEADPNASFLTEELSDLYIRAGRLREAVEEAEARLKKDPNDVNARWILARIYTRLIGDARRGAVDENMLRKAIEQYEKISQLEPDNQDLWFMLGRLYRLAHNSVKAEDAFRKVLQLDPGNDEALLGLAMVYSDLGDRPRAAKVLEEVAGKSPSVRILSHLGSTYEEMEEYEKAAEAYRRALQLSPDNQQLKRALAQALLLADKPDEALPLYQQLVEEDPEDYYSYLRLSQIYRDKRQFDEAARALEQAKKLSPGNLEVLYNEVNLLEAQGRLGEAIEALKHILEITKKNNYSQGELANRRVFLERLGLLYRNNNQYDEAVATFRQLAELDPSLAPRVAAQIADTYRQAKQFQRALEAIEPAYQQYPGEEIVAVMRATILADLGRWDEAVQCAEKALQEKKDRESWLTLAQVYEKARRFDAMAQALNEAEKLSHSKPEQVTVWFLRGVMYERSKRYEQADEAFQKVLELDPNNASAMNYLGYMLADRNVQLERALKLLQRAVELDPENGAYLDSLGWVYFRLGQFDKAREYLERAVQKVPRDPIVHDHLGDVYAQLGNLKKAIEHWRISLKEWETASATEKDPEQIAGVRKKLEGAEFRLAREAQAAAKP